jgi:lysozyme family protein
MQTVQQLINSIIEAEGGYVNNPHDAGGPTKYGITQATLSVYLGRHASIADVKSITKKVAYSIYYNKYYISTDIYKLSECIRPIMLDICVNSWIKVATILLQKAINGLSNTSSVIVDGKLGPKTIEEAARLSTIDCNKLVNAIVYMRIDFYKSIVENNPSQKVFLAGWLNRANSFLT